MDNLKTGLLIRELRKQKGMTQKALAELLHITDRAVSKWERGLCAPDLSTLEPLAKALDISVNELIAGERMTVQTPVDGLERAVKEVIAYSENEIGKKTRAVKIKLAIGCAATCATLLAFLIFIYSPVIFQRGNPIPYLAAAMQINEDRPYVQVAVNDNAGIYISHRGECPALFNYIEDTWNATFREQMGGTYFFVTDADTLMVSAEVYWAKFTVWTIPNVTLVGG